MVHTGQMPKREARVKKDAEYSGGTHRKVAGKHVCVFDFRDKVVYLNLAVLASYIFNRL